MRAIIFNLYNQLYIEQNLRSYKESQGFAVFSNINSVEMWPQTITLGIIGSPGTRCFFYRCDLHVIIITLRVSSIKKIHRVPGPPMLGIPHWIPQCIACVSHPDAFALQHLPFKSEGKGRSLHFF